jgi:hypothetical protein
MMFHHGRRRRRKEHRRVIIKSRVFGLEKWIESEPSLPEVLPLDSNHAFHALLAAEVPAPLKSNVIQGREQRTRAKVENSTQVQQIDL